MITWNSFDLDNHYKYYCKDAVSSIDTYTPKRAALLAWQQKKQNPFEQKIFQKQTEIVPQAPRELSQPSKKEKADESDDSKRLIAPSYQIKSAGAILVVGVIIGFVVNEVYNHWKKVEKIRAHRRKKARTIYS